MIYKLAKFHSFFCQRLGLNQLNKDMLKLDWVRISAFLAEPLLNIGGDETLKFQKTPIIQLQNCKGLFLYSLYQTR